MRGSKGAMRGFRGAEARSMSWGTEERRIIGRRYYRELSRPANEQYKGAERGSKSAEARSKARGCSSSPENRGAADNRTEIISPANEQYKGRKSLAGLRRSRGAKEQASLAGSSEAPRACSARENTMPQVR